MLIPYPFVLKGAFCGLVGVHFSTSPLSPPYCINCLLALSTEVFHVAGVIRNLTASLWEDTAPTEGPAEQCAPYLPQPSQREAQIEAFCASGGGLVLHRLRRTWCVFLSAKLQRQ